MRFYKYLLEIVNVVIFYFYFVFRLVIVRARVAKNGRFLPKFLLEEYFSGQYTTGTTTIPTVLRDSACDNHRQYT